MVSTRGVKLKFVEGERVLCYEPDPTKAKVLYDSKVLDVVFNKDQKGKKNVEYLIHFQGWNSSWDRCVSEEFVLKDTPENRQLQRDLAEKSQLQLNRLEMNSTMDQNSIMTFWNTRRKSNWLCNRPLSPCREEEILRMPEPVSEEKYILSEPTKNDDVQFSHTIVKKRGAYLYRRERKKHSRKTNDNTAGQCSEDGSSGSPARMDTDEGQATSSSDDDSSTEEDFIPIELTSNLKQLLENDYHMINSNNLLHKLPAVPNVANILEIYFKYFSNHQVCNNYDKNGSRYRNYYYTHKPTAEDIQKNLLSFREFLDGMRLYFDNTLEDLLLYKPEKNVFLTSQLTYSSISNMTEPTLQNNNLDDHLISGKLKEEENGIQNNHNTEQEINIGASRRKTLRSYSNQESQHMNGNSHSTEVVNSCNNGSKPCPSIASSNSETSAPPFTMKIISWKLLPELAYHKRPPPPCLVYGATHLTRLLVKMPELLGASNITDTNLKNLIRHMDLFIDFLSEHKEWYGETYYQGV